MFSPTFQRFRGGFCQRYLTNPSKLSFR